MADYAPPPDHQRLYLEIQYLGTHFQGWQMQAKGERTVQAELHTALSRFAEAHVPVACGRTDTGVHAENMPVHVDVKNLRVPISKLKRALNAHLPEDLSVLKAEEARTGFHARFSCKWRAYRYDLLLCEERRPLYETRALRVPYVLNLKQMEEAAALLIGEHDFRAFATQEERQTRRIIYGCHLEHSGVHLSVHIRGESFLRHQIRAIIGTLLLIGSGRQTLSEFEVLLQGKNRAEAGPNVKPHGLHFLGAGY
ncbi:tRNA pseudouridine(38-40) synthase TruA [Deinococcus cellulosilyticus]|uniref:tRNA pseudouridine synthase A n=1 Tax=Deinococcus cellulosilyticus (strain DSM 18568 / NBRC 106333 / KACC 11606 / 5516J-15) TaxID=1223518 RepID=A0A511N4J2_DEIC1|nr:tRNA pseudouridine(38-40) synthase TruA [Deinococcus cellulosilyticus]GEM47794.1 tRNA pseudouridine synthase A [Deinococcus cellulosilyticus NBRC 106333 = KACC 11606]